MGKVPNANLFPQAPKTPLLSEKAFGEGLEGQTGRPVLDRRQATSSGGLRVRVGRLQRHR